MIRIQPFEPQHWVAVWRILEPVFRAGESYAFSTDITEEEARHAWIETRARGFQHARLGYVDALVLFKQLQP